jgi:hypothetical protein
MPSRCSAGCHAPCSSAALRSGSSYVRHQALFIRSSFTHCTMLTALVWRCAGPQLQAHSSFLVYTITSPANTLFAWFHSLIRHYFISASCRPSAAFCSYARRQAIACVPGLHWHKPSLITMPHFAPSLCAHRSRDRLLYWSPQALALAGRFRSLGPHSQPRPFTRAQNQIQHLGSKQS